MVHALLYFQASPEGLALLLGLPLGLEELSEPVPGSAELVSSLGAHPAALSITTAATAIQEVRVFMMCRFLLVQTA